MSSEKEVAIEAAKSAGKFLLENFGKEQKVVKEEISTTTTQADKDSEKIILGIIKKNFPNHSILSEEKGLDQKKSEYLWLVDPLDGTTNYTTKIPVFDVSIALATNGEITLGVVYNPILDEMFVAEKGKGAYLNNKKIKVSEKTNLIKSRLMIYKGKEEEHKRPFLKNFNELFPKVKVVRVISASALELCYVACGRFEMFINNGSYPYDYAAGALIVKEAGGKITDLKGRPWNLETNEIIASNKILNKKIVSLINN